MLSSQRCVHLPILIVLPGSVPLIWFWLYNLTMFFYIIQIRNTRTVNRTGQLTGFKLLPGSNCLPLAGSEAKFLRRAAFLKHNLWVTPYARDEMYPGGEFPNQNPRVGEGLATWVKQNRSLEETDIVLWLVLSFFVSELLSLACFSPLTSKSE